jgi:hypothetical protein
VTPEAYAENNIWDRIPMDPCDQITIAHHFKDIFKKKSLKIDSTLKCTNTRDQDTNIGELMRAIALSGKSEPAASFALGIAMTVGSKP